MRTFRARVLSSIVLSTCFSSLEGSSHSPLSPMQQMVLKEGVIEIAGRGDPLSFGEVRSVAINGSGVAIIGGKDQEANPYAVFVSSSGLVTKIHSSSSSGSIESVAINRSGYALIGGQNRRSNDPYLGIVAPCGQLQEIKGEGAPIGSGVIRSVALNEEGRGIVGGVEKGHSTPYVALITPSGESKKLALQSEDLLPTAPGSIDSVAINNTGAGVIGGRQKGFMAPYVARISSEGILTSVLGKESLEEPEGFGGIASVAINDSGTAIIGGQDKGFTGMIALTDHHLLEFRDKR